MRVRQNFELKSIVRYKFEMSSGEKKDFTFELVPKDEGVYPLTIGLFLSLDRFDYQKDQAENLAKHNCRGRRSHISK